MSILKINTIILNTYVNYLSKYTFSSIYKLKLKYKSLLNNFFICNYTIFQNK